MKYFLDTEFLEGTQNKLFGKTKPTIDLISIGILCEDRREYYAISKDFNLKEVWNRYQMKHISDDSGNMYPESIKEYWLRDNVLKSIWIELRAKEVEEYNIAQKRNVILNFPEYNFTYKTLKRLINKYGKTNEQIAEEVRNFVYKGGETFERFKEYHKEESIEFYGYYADYDWVVFCWLFGNMIDLPKGFPMYCIDLKQTLDEKQKFNQERYKVGDLKKFAEYPKQISEHNALSDAKWNFELYKFLNQL